MGKHKHCITADYFFPLCQLRIFWVATLHNAALISWHRAAEVARGANMSGQGTRGHWPAVSNRHYQQGLDGAMLDIKAVKVPIDHFKRSILIEQYILGNKCFYSHLEKQQYMQWPRCLTSPEWLHGNSRLATLRPVLQWLLTLVTPSRLIHQGPWPTLSPRPPHAE